MRGIAKANAHLMLLPDVAGFRLCLTPPTVHLCTLVSYIADILKRLFPTVDKRGVQVKFLFKPSPALSVISLETMDRAPFLYSNERCLKC